LCSGTIFLNFNSWHLWDNVERCYKSHVTIWHMHFAYWMHKATYTLRIGNIYWF
jgi:hypothetical protein